MPLVACVKRSTADCHYFGGNADAAAGSDADGADAADAAVAAAAAAAAAAADGGSGSIAARSPGAVDLRCCMV
jgi:hypothetical protein